jgi:hypothetical protein
MLMKTKLKILIALISFTLLGNLYSCQFLQSESKVYVSTSGNDVNPGTKQKPLKTLSAARDLVRSKRAENPKLKQQNIAIILREGSYVLEETLVLEPVDSNLIFKTYEEETASIVGGKQINNWKPLTEKLEELVPDMEEKIWKAEIPKGWLFHYLFVNGQRAERSKSDHRFWREWQKDHIAGEPEKQGQLVTFENKEQLRYLPSNGDAEMLCIMYQFGVMGNGVISDVDANAGTLRWNSKLTNIRGSRHGGERGYRFENALCYIDRPGEWAVDSEKGIVYYYPKENEDMNDVSVIAPKLNRLVYLKGNEEQNSLVKYITFDGITFAYTDRLPENEWPDDWLCRQWENVDATLYFQGTQNCKVLNCRILHSGSYGITIKHNGQNNYIENNEIGWTGSGGVFFEGYGPGTLDVNKYNTITRNYIHDHGLGNYWHSPSVQIYQSGYNNISYNLLQRSAYSSVSMVGMHPTYMSDAEKMFPGTYYGQWHAWSYFCPRPQDYPKEVQEGIKNGTYKFDRETIKPYLHSRNNVVEYNIISEPHSKLNEGGAIYAWCCGKNNVWSNNVIFKSRAMPGSSILALDDMAEYTTVTGNVFWIEGTILDGVGARKNERGNAIHDNVRANYKEEYRSRRGHENIGEGKWWVNDPGREALDKLLNEITTEVESRGGWPGNPENGIPNENEPITKYGELIMLPEGANVTIEE